MRKLLNPKALSLLLLLIPVLYLATMAHSPVLGDPSEYTFVANILGIAHPPGYAFITLIGKLFQTVIPFGEISWRMHLLSVTAASIAAFLVYATTETLTRSATVQGGTISDLPLRALAAIFGAFIVATGTDFWQHAIHANPHIITATFLAANLFFLTRWWAAIKSNAAEHKGNESHQAHRWLFAFSFSAGLGITHHPLTVFTFPAYAIFILIAQPSILRDWKTILKMVAFALLGLTLWLYFPIRSGMEPPFGPSTMNTLEGFLDHVLGRGITEALPYFSLDEQPDRALVFWSILRLQYSLPVIFLALFTLTWPILDKITSGKNNAAPRPTHAPSPLLLLYTLAFLCNYAFVISLKAQDIMAYLLGPLLIIGLLAGIGLYALLNYVNYALRPGKTWMLLLVSALFLLGPIIQIVRNATLISLRQYNEGIAYVDAVFSNFASQNEGAILLNDWEHMTPLWYAQFVEQRWPDPVNVRPEYVSTARTWLDNVYDFLPGGPVYLSNYRREIVDAGFRLRPFGPFYRVVEPGDESMPPELSPTASPGQDIEIVGYLLPETKVSAGDYVHFTLAMRSAQGTSDYYVPVLQVGELTLPFTTDSHLVTPEWLPGEIIVERFDFALPHDLPTGDYPITVSLKNLSTDENTDALLSPGILDIRGEAYPIPLDNLLANFRQRVGLKWATARAGSRSVAAPWDEPLIAQPGDTIPLTLGWKSLGYAEESYTIFVHLIDLANRPIVALDYTPLGGAAPTHLWIPKWLPSQGYMDPYRLTLPDELAPGTYLIEVGLYEMVGKRRLHIADEKGNLVGDRYILGSINVEASDS
jgi:hypothetical protein